MPNKPSADKRAVTFRLKRELLDRATAKAAATGETMTSVVERALDAWAPVTPPSEPHPQ